MALALGAVGSGPGTAFDALREGSPTEDTAGVLAAAAGVGVQTSSSAGTTLGAQSGGGGVASGGGGLDGLRETGGGTMAVAEGTAVTERRVGRMRLSGGGERSAVAVSSTPGSSFDVSEGALPRSSDATSVSCSAAPGFRGRSASSSRSPRREPSRALGWPPIPSARPSARAWCRW